MLMAFLLVAIKQNFLKTNNTEKYTVKTKIPPPCFQPPILPPDCLPISLCDLFFLS